MLFMWDKCREPQLTPEVLIGQLLGGAVAVPSSRLSDIVGCKPMVYISCVLQCVSRVGNFKGEMGVVPECICLSICFLMSQLPQNLIVKIEKWRSHFCLGPGRSPHALESSIVEIICFPISQIQTSQYELYKYIQILDVLHGTGFSFFYVTREEYDWTFPIYCDCFFKKIAIVSLQR